jgi:hypothetical protein
MHDITMAIATLHDIRDDLTEGFGI